MSTDLTHQRINYLHSYLPFFFFFLLVNIVIQFRTWSTTSPHSPCDRAFESRSPFHFLLPPFSPARLCWISDTKVNLSSQNLFKDTFKVSIGPVGIGEGLSKRNRVRQERRGGRIWRRRVLNQSRLDPRESSITPLSWANRRLRCLYLRALARMIV